MGFKADTSFLKYLSMGAIGVKQTMAQLKSEGFQPIELERYCGSNKIWATKVKRLRLPDVFCVRTGLRFEIRAKSDLAIKMSDAEKNPERRWDAGLRNDDIAAFIAISEHDGEQKAAEKAVFLEVKTLRDSVSQSKLGPPKSAGEGSEKDRTWPACIPGRSGKVLAVEATKIRTLLSGNGAERKQSYPLKGGKHAYVRAGETFVGEASIIAGVPRKLADLSTYLSRQYDPIKDLKSSDPIQRFAAAKALPYRAELHQQGRAELEKLIPIEPDERVALEMAGSAAKLGSTAGEQKILAVLNNQSAGALRMEAVFILTELKTEFAQAQLVKIANNTKLKDDELRQAAIWGLGKAGMKQYETIVPLLADEYENVAMHAIVSIGKDASEEVIRAMIEELKSGNNRRAAAASEALRLCATETSVRLLVDAAKDANTWVVATLGRFPSALVQPMTDGTPLGEKLAPMLLLAEGANWLASEDAVIDVAFLDKQNLY